MMVCAHGEVADFCKERDMVICETWEGDLRAYRGNCRVLVTDSDISENEYYFLKGDFLSRGIELISTRYRDDKRMVDYLAYNMSRRRMSHGTRPPFGFRRDGGELVAVPESMVVARRILALREVGATLREIRDDDAVHHRDGRKLSVSTIQTIIKNKKLYE